MFKFVSRISSVLLVAGLATTAQAALDVSGYFDVELVHQKDSRPYVRQHHLNLLLQHSYENYRFFAEIEFEDATDFDFGRIPVTDDDNTGGKTQQGRLFVERAYGEVTWGPMVNLKVGQMLHTTYYYLNHYPSLTYNFADPSTRKSLFDYNIKGAILWGEKDNWYYDLWTSRGPTEADNTTGSHEYGMNWGAKLAYTLGSGTRKATLAVLTAEYANKIGLGVDRSVAGEVVVNWDKYILMSEFGERVDDVTSTNTVRAGYVLGAYTHTMEDGSDISPYIMLDTYDTNSNSDYYEARTRNAIGVNYKPNAAITWKLEHLTTNSYKKTATTSADSTTQSALVFVYFYN